MQSVEDPRVKEGICKATYFDTAGREWICVAQPHAKIYKRRKGDRNHYRGELIFTPTRKADQHYMVNRWPNREVTHDN